LACSRVKCGGATRQKAIAAIAVPAAWGAMPTEPKALPENVAAALAYVTFVPASVFLVTPPYCNHPNIRFHAWQSVFLAVTTFVVSFVLTLMIIFGLLFGALPVLAINTVVWSAWLLAWLVCVVQAAEGKRFHLPLLGQLAERQARISPAQG